MAATGLTVGALVVSGLTVLFGIIVMGTISDKVKGTAGSIDYCLFDEDFTKNAPCDFGIAMGVFGFVAGLAFSVLALLAVIKPDLIPEALQRVLTMVRIGVAMVLAFLFLVCFGVMAHAWSTNDHKTTSSSKKNAAQGAMAFAFFSIGAWVSLAVLYFLHLRSSMGSSSSGKTGEPASGPA